MHRFSDRTLGSFVWQRVLATAALAVLVASCTASPNQGGGGGSIFGGSSCQAPGMSPAESNLCHDNETFRDTVVGGAIVGGIGGAALGAGACALSGSRDIGKCAAIGGGVGVVGGALGGYLVAKQQQANTEHRRQIDAVTDDIQKQNATLRDEIASAQQVLQASRARLQTLGTDERAGRISADDANAARDRVGHDIKNLTELIGKIETQEKNFEQAGQQSGQRSTDYTREITEMKRNIAALTQQRDALNAALSSSQQS
jgi:hypothetical protein